MGLLRKSTGSEKGYILLKMQLALIVAIAISFAYTILEGSLYLLQIIPAFVLLRSLSELRKHSEDVRAYSAIFFTLLMLIIATPFLFRGISFALVSPLQTVNYMVYAVFAVLILLFLTRTMRLKKTVKGRVVLADQKIAVSKWI